MAQTNGSNVGAIVGIVAIIAIIVLIYFVFIGNNGNDELEIEIDPPGQSSLVEPRSSNASA
jgi:hypothetical protein